MDFKGISENTSKASASSSNTDSRFRPTVEGLVELFRSLPKKNSMGTLSVHMSRSGKIEGAIELLSEKSIKSWGAKGFRPVSNQSRTNYSINYGRVH